MPDGITGNSPSILQVMFGSALKKVTITAYSIKDSGMMSSNLSVKSFPVSTLISICSVTGASPPSGTIVPVSDSSSVTGRSVIVALYELVVELRFSDKVKVPV